MFSTVLEISPPLILTEPEAGEGGAILDQALSDLESGKVGDEAIARCAGW
jgi:4-aminobutyrate aminotransferase